MRRPTLVALAAAALLAACATTTPSAPVAATVPDCKAIYAEMETSRAARQSAIDAKATAWKAVLPVLVVGRYVNAASNAAAAEDRIAALQRHALLEDCHAR